MAYIKRTPYKNETRSDALAIKAELSLSEPENILFWAIALTAFYGLACLGELLLTTQQDGDNVPVFRALRFDKANNYIFATIQLARIKNYKLKQLLSTEDVAGYSFRAGGTTELVM
ncbi:690_t:CDS:2 [Dentiscutata erythropus]|uniref:690_t:CDS:1 n=1 Tax=Dentiscutata erythropus TaxID=1348616 RepID=A0A9N8VRZ9_9GLOM|nr:690_t:CDS:2 [Dentiscutata erythropus]